MAPKTKFPAGSTVATFQRRVPPDTGFVRRTCYNFLMEDEFPKVMLPQLSTLVTEAPAGGGTGGAKGFPRSLQA